MASPEDLAAGVNEQPDTLAHLRVLAKVLGLREAFLVDLLLDKDDWSFVVKAHALQESVISMLIAMHLQKQALQEVLADQVSMRARIAMTKALDITTSEERAAMQALSELRNRLVHNAKDTTFTFAEHFENKNYKDNFAKTFGRGFSDPIELNGIARPRADFVATNPKLAIFQTVTNIAMHVVTEALKINTEMAIESLHRVAPVTWSPAQAPRHD